MRTNRLKSTKQGAINFRAPALYILLGICLSCWLGGFVVGFFFADASFETLTTTQQKLTACEQRLMDCTFSAATRPFLDSLKD